MNQKQRKTLEAVYTQPALANIVWQDIENLFVALGAVVREGRGSRVRVEMNGVVAVFHRPHPEKEASKGRVKAVREFLEKAGVELTEDEI
jgi:HicA toxin of bacterial toxin-antitoxin,